MSRIRHPRQHRHVDRRDPDAVPDPRSRRARAQHREDGRTTPRRTACATAATARCTNRSTCGNLQENLGGAVGVCCQKVSEAEVFARGGIKRHPRLERGAATRPRSIGWRGCRSTAPASSSASTISPTSPTSRPPPRSTARTIECFVEIDCGAGRCGVKTRRGGGRDRQGDRRRARPEVRRHPGLSGRDAAPRQISRTARPSSTPRSPRSKDAVEL